MKIGNSHIHIDDTLCIVHCSDDETLQTVEPNITENNFIRLIKEHELFFLKNIRLCFVYFHMYDGNE